jgi:hypothetical protein
LLEVNFDERDLDRQQCIAQRDARVREPCRIEQNQRDVARRSQVDPADQLRLRVALERRQPMAGLCRQLRHALVDLLERDVPVNPRLADSEQVQVRPIQE